MNHAWWQAALSLGIMIAPAARAQTWLLPPPVGVVNVFGAGSSHHRHHHFVSFSTYLLTSSGSCGPRGYLRWSGFHGTSVAVYTPPFVVINQPVVVVKASALPADIDRAAWRRKGIIIGDEDEGPQQPAPKPRPAPVPPPRPIPPPPVEPPPEAGDARLLRLGKTAFAGGQYGLAARRFRQATTLSTVNPEAFFLLAQAQFALGKYAQAVDAIRTGLRLRPDWPISAFHPVDLYSDNASDLLDQIARLREAVDRFPRDADALFLLGYEEWFVGRRDAALPLFRRALGCGADRDAVDAFLSATPQ